MLSSECAGLSVCAFLSEHYVGSGLIVDAEPSECAVMIMFQGQERQQKRCELVIFKSSAPWLCLNVTSH